MITVQRWLNTSVETMIGEVHMMTAEQIQASITALENISKACGIVTAQLKIITDALVVLRDNMALTLLEGAPRVLFVSPVTGVASDTANPFGGAWFDATGYATKYGVLNHYHTGVDLNLPNYADSGKPVYAAADGEIVFSGAVPGWQGEVVCIKHMLEDGSLIWTRYAHIENVLGLGRASKGQAIGRIADYNKNGPAGDHLHFDVSKIDLGAHPDDWPGTDLARVLHDYIDPAKWLAERKS